MANRKRKIQMDYQQCAEHSGTADGAQPLKNPELVRKSSKDVNRGLCPWSSSKKGKNMQCEFGSNSKPLITSDDIGVSVANSSSDSNTHAGYSNSINQIGTVDYSCQKNSHLEGMPVKQGQNSSLISRTKCSFDSYKGVTSRQLYPNQNPTLANNFIPEIDSKRTVSCQKRKDLGNCECLPEVEQNKTYMHECSVPRYNNSSQSLQNSRTSSDRSLYASELSSPKRKLPDDFLSLAKFKIISPLNSSKPTFSSNNLTSERDYASKLNAQTSSEDVQSPASGSNMIRMTDFQASKRGCRSGEDNCLLKSVRRNLINNQSGIKLSSEVTTDDPNLLAFEDSSDDDLMIHASQEAEKRCATSSPVMDSNLEAFEDDSFLDNLSPTMLDNMEKENYVANTFGLLGSSQVDDDADEPEEDEEQGYFTCLPDEILEMIFSYLSINVCCNICGVCKRWSRIILNHKFLPWKKLYQRYKISEESGVSAVEAIYTTHSFGDAKSCLLKLIKYMSEFKTLDKYFTVGYMDRHPMFQLSCDLLAERAPDLVVEGVPNLWSLLATLVILSRNTQDISQAIKYSLQSPCEHSALIESFYCIATMLLMLQYKHGINCGLHYRLYHVLYHYETGSSLAYSMSRIAIQVSSSKDSLMMQNSEHVMTQEQVAIVSYKLTPREIVKIIAFAGTGKTSTLINFTLRNPKMKFLYVAFNKSVEEYAKRNFPYNVECRTTHSLAYRDVGFRYKNKLTPSWRLYNLVCLLEPKAIDRKNPNMPLYVRAKLVMKTVKNFIASDDDYIMLLHVPEKEREEGHSGKSRWIKPQRRKDLLEDARNLWERMRNPSDFEATVTHDAYLKLYQLRKPKLPAVDCILIDEAQDLTPAQQAILLQQDCAKILVGDPHQQIYSFRGATNALQNISATKTFHLTQSFRFGPEIAYVANCVLQAFKDVKGKNVIGVEALGSVLGEEVGQIAIICRTNLSLFNEAAKLCAQNQTVRVGLVGGVRSYRFNQILDIYRLYAPESERRKPGNEIQDKFVRGFSSIAQLQKFADNIDDMELLGRINIVRTHHIKIPEHIERITSRAVADISQAEVVFSTAHKAKGLEFDTVKVTCDFLTDTSEGNLVGFSGAQHHVQVQLNQKPPEDELNLLYVALTRAKKRLKLTNPILKMLTKLNEAFAYPVSTQAIIRNAEGALVKCWQCSLEIESNTVLVFERLNIDLGYSLQASRPAGFMCSWCAGAEHLGFSSLVSQYSSNDPLTHVSENP